MLSLLLILLIDVDFGGPFLPDVAVPIVDNLPDELKDVIAVECARVGLFEPTAEALDFNHFAGAINVMRCRKRCIWIPGVTPKPKRVINAAYATFVSGAIARHLVDAVQLSVRRQSSVFVIQGTPEYRHSAAVVTAFRKPSIQVASLQHPDVILGRRNEVESMDRHARDFDCCNRLESEQDRIHRYWREDEESRKRLNDEAARRRTILNRKKANGNVFHQR